MAKCLVLGGSGFIGSHIVDELASKGHQVRVFGKFDSKIPSSANTNIEYMPGDFLNRNSLELATKDIDYVFHLISTTTPLLSENDPLVDIHSNVEMSIELLSLCVKNKVKKVIFASSGGSIYGDVGEQNQVSEDQLPKPVSPYAIGKLTIEHYLRYFKKKHGLDFMVTRISNPYGPRQNILNGQGVISIFLNNTINDKPIKIYGDGSMVRDYIYVEDVAKMIVDVFQNNNQHEIYNIGSSQGYSVNQIIEVVENITGQTLKKDFVESPSTFIQKIVLDTSRYVSEFGTPNFTKLEEGLDKTWQYLKEKS